jgi:hypothetical protein
MIEKPLIARIEAEESVFDELALLCEIRGMTQKEVLSRLVRWFARQDEKIQIGVISAATDFELTQARCQLLKHLAANTSNSRPPIRDAPAPSR